MISRIFVAIAFLVLANLATAWAEDVDERGSKRWWVADVAHFCAWYEDLLRQDQRPRHFYQVIEGGGRVSLYADLEYSRTLNPTLDPAVLGPLGPGRGLTVNPIPKKFSYRHYDREKDSLSR